MSIASSSEDIVRRERWAVMRVRWAVMRVEMVAAGVPVEAWPMRLPRAYNAYTVKSAGGALVQVQLAVRAFLVPMPLPEWDRGHSVSVRWGDVPDVASAWAFAQQVAGW